MASNWVIAAAIAGGLYLLTRTGTAGRPSVLGGGGSPIPILTGSFGGFDAETFASFEDVPQRSTTINIFSPVPDYRPFGGFNVETFATFEDPLALPGVGIPVRREPVQVDPFGGFPVEVFASFDDESVINEATVTSPTDPFGGFDVETFASFDDELAVNEPNLDAARAEAEVQISAMEANLNELLSEIEAIENEPFGGFDVETFASFDDEP